MEDGGLGSGTSELRRQGHILLTWPWAPQQPCGRQWDLVPQSYCFFQSRSWVRRPGPVGCFPILLCSGEDCPSLGISSRAEAKARALCQRAAQPSRPLPSWGLLDIVPRVTVGTQEIRIMGKGRPRVLLTPGEGPLRSRCLDG